MTRLLLTAAVTLLAAGAAQADPADGLWKTKPDDNGHFGYIQMAPCGEKLCGTLVKSFDKDGKPMKSDNIGKQIVWDMVPEGDGRYDKGKVWAPDRDQTYSAHMVLAGDSLTVAGCILGGLICRNGGAWTRVK